MSTPAPEDGARRLVSILRNQDDWEPSGDDISYEDDIRGRKLARLVLEAEAAYGGESLSEADARKWLLDGADVPSEVRAWAEDGAEPGELYRFVNNVACE